MSAKKLLIWDGDNTLWKGTLLDGDILEFTKSRRRFCAVLCSMGVVQSIASTNLQRDIDELVHRFDIEPFFVANRGSLEKSKPTLIREIMEDLNIVREGDVVFIDDQEINRREVADELPGVTTLATISDGLVSTNTLFELFAKDDYTAEDRDRVHMYKSELERKKAGQAHQGDRIEFFKACDMKASVTLAKEDELNRIWSLVERAHRLSGAAAEYSRGDIEQFVARGELWVLRASDKYGDYGLCGVVQVSRWNSIGLLTISCRLQGKGYGSYLLGTIMQKHQSIRAHWIETEYNAGIRSLYEWYKFNIRTTKSEPRRCLAISTTTTVSLPSWISTMSAS